MKRIVYILLIPLLLILSAFNARAGFIIKKQHASLQTANTTQTPEGQYLNLQQASTHTLFQSPLQKAIDHLTIYRRRPSEWIGIAALLSGVLGLFIPGVNFLALLFGVLGMGRNCKSSGLAIAGFVLGVLETLLFVFFGTMFLSLILL